jgi:chromosome segregation ATPase
MDNTKLLCLFLAWVLSAISRRYHWAVALFLALLSIPPQLGAQQQRIEKLEDEYRGQRSINRACLERHRAAVLKLEQEKSAIAAELEGEKEKAKEKEKGVCVRVHYEERDAVTEERNKELGRVNEELVQRVVGLERREARLLEHIARFRRDRTGLRERVGRFEGRARQWEGSARRYERAWRKEVEKRRRSANV